MVETATITEVEIPTKTEKQKSFKEKVSYAKTIDILSVCESLGIGLEKSGRTIRGVEHNSLVMYPKMNRFKWFSQDISGDAITFVQLFADKTFKEAVEFLNTTDLIETTIKYEEKKKPKFYYYVQDKNDFSLAKDYLVDVRGINEKLIARLYDEGFIRQSTYMPFYPESKEEAPCITAKWERHGKLVGGTIQGLTYDEEKFGKRGRDKRIMGNSESNYGWNYTIGTPDKIVVGESFIDLLSYWTLHPTLDNCMFVDLEGLKERSLVEFLKDLVVEKKGNIDKGVILAVDNDAAGQKFVDKLSSKYQFTTRENYQLAQPYNNAVSKEHMMIYQRIGTEYNVDPIAIATVHKAFTNGSNTNELANPWKNEQFFGKVLGPKEKPEPINVIEKSKEAAQALAKVKSESNTYDFTKLVVSRNDTKETRQMVEKLERIQLMYKTQGIEVKEEVLKDWNDVLKAARSSQERTSVKEGDLYKPHNEMQQNVKIEEVNVVPTITKEKNGEPSTNKPMVLFHGSEKSFDEFQLQSVHTSDATSMGYGLYFTDNKERAEMYANEGYLYEVSGDLLTSRAVYDERVTLTIDEVELLINHIAESQLQGEEQYPFIIADEAELSSEVMMDEGNKQISHQLAEEVVNSSSDDLSIINDLNNRLGGDFGSNEYLNEALEQLNIKYGIKDFVLDDNTHTKEYVVFDPKNITILSKSELNQEIQKEDKSFEQQVDPFDVANMEEPPNIEDLSVFNETFEQNEATEIKDKGVIETQVNDLKVPLIERLVSDLNQFEEQMIQLDPKEIFKQSEIISGKGKLVEKLSQMNMDDPKVQTFVKTLEASKEPLNDAFESIKEDTSLLTNQKDFEAQFPDKFLEFMDQKHSKEQVIYTLPVEVEKTVELVLEGISQELDAIENGTFTPVQEMRVSLQVDYLKEQLIANELVEVQENKLVVSERGDQLKEGSKIRELVDAYTNVTPQSMVELTESIVNIHKKEEEKSVFTLSEDLENKIDLVLEGLTKEITELEKGALSPSDNMRLTIQMDYLNQQLIDNQLIEDKDGKKIPGKIAGQLPEDSKLAAMIQVMTNDSIQTAYDSAEKLSEVHKTYMPTAGKVELNLTRLNEFKKWANEYDGVGKEYVPIDEINELKLTPENLIVLESADTWFHSLGDYLVTHKDFNFGQSVAFQNAQVFVENLVHEDRDQLVMKDKLEALKHVSLDVGEGKLVPEATKAMYQHTSTFMGVKQNQSEKGKSANESTFDATKMEPMLVMAIPGTEPKTFKTFAEFNEFAQEVNANALKQNQLNMQKENLQNELVALNDWAKQYDGLDKEYIPYHELAALNVKQNEAGVYMIQDIVNGAYVREYANVQAYLQSFDGNAWSETISYQSATTYFDNRDNQDRLYYEVMSQNLLAKKESHLSIPIETKEQEISAAAWKNIYVEDFETWSASANKKMIYFQDPTRVGNPIYFDRQEQAENFVQTIVNQNEEVTSEREQKENEAQSKKGFFRRGKKETSIETKSEAVITDHSSKNQSVNQNHEPKGSKITDKVLFEPGTKEENKKERAATLSPSFKENATTKDLVEYAREGVKDFLESDKYKQYLKTMSQFHNYSWSNTILILQQMPNAKAVAGFQTWKKVFERHVVKGQKGIKILAPMNIKQEQTKTKEINGKKETVTEEVTVRRFKTMTVFDVSQTDGAPMPTLTKELSGPVNDYSKLFEAIASTTSYKIEFEEIQSGAKGYCDFGNKRIALNKGMSEAQTIKTLIHEITHSHLHEPKLREDKDRRTMEVEAESVAFVVCSRFGLDTSDYSFGYLASWSSGKEVKELTQSFATIQKQADKVITGINESLEELSKEKQVEQGVGVKLGIARGRSDNHNENVKKSQAQERQQGKKNPQKER